MLDEFDTIFKTDPNNPDTDDVYDLEESKRNTDPNSPMMVARQEPYQFDISRTGRGISVESHFSIYDHSDYLLFESDDFITWRIRGKINEAEIIRYDRNSIHR